MTRFIPFCCCSTSGSSSLPSSSPPPNSPSSSPSSSSSVSSSSSSSSSSRSSSSGRPCSCSSAPGTPGEFNGQTFINSCRVNDSPEEIICPGGTCISTWTEPDPVGNPGVGSWILTTDTCTGITY